MKKTALILLGLAAMIFAQSASICLNTIGYLPDQEKKATITAECSSFAVVSDKGKTVFEAQVTGPIDQKDVDQKVWIADFSQFKKKGTFHLEIPNVGKSVEFKIAKDVYNFSFYTAMRAMYLWRCGTAVHGEFNGIVYEHDVCHLDDGYLDYIGEENVQKDGVGGWHDAGDHGKYVVNAGITVASMFYAWDHFEKSLKKYNLDLPETAPGFPQFLKEIKWETDWLLKMQYPDGSGKIAHKLTRTNFSGFIMPEDDDEKRFYTPWSTAATADFVAMMAMASRYFQPYDTDYADLCLQAALNSYKCLKENPENEWSRAREFKTGAYGTGDGDDRMWAAAELWETTGDAEFLQDFEKQANEYVPRTWRGEATASADEKIDVDWDWGNVRNLAMFTYLLSEKSGKSQELFSHLKNNLVAVADSIVAIADKDVYGRPLGGKYYWGCNGTIARQVINLQVANKLAPNPAYTQTALDAVSHLFGRNYYNRSFVTGLGYNPPMHPHDRRSGADDIEAPWPGYVVGGGHAATDWVDEQESYATNEIAINWQGALIYALAGFIH